MREIAGARQTMLIVTHEMRFAGEIADRVLFMEGGRIVEQGPPDAMFSNPSDPRTRRFLRQVLPDAPGRLSVRRRAGHPSAPRRRGHRRGRAVGVADGARPSPRREAGARRSSRP